MLSLKLKQFAKIRANSASKCQIAAALNTITNGSAASPYGGSNTSSATPWLASRAALTSQVSKGTINDNNNSLTDPVVMSFKEWFKNRNDALLYEIFKIIGSNPDDDEDDVSLRRSTDLVLSNMRLRLNEAFVLEVLEYGKHKDVLSCLKFFDWAGRQPGFKHTRATFYAIFKILAKARRMSRMLEFIDSFIKQSYTHKVQFLNTLVMGYAVAGKPHFALQLFGRMRFQGLDLDSFGYHALLNALVEESSFDAALVISRQIRMRGLESEVTRFLTAKSLCKQKLLGEAEAYIRGVLSDGRSWKGRELGVLIEALCKNDEFDHAEKLIEEFQNLGTIPMDDVYDVWLQGLVGVGRLDAALEFLKKQKSLDMYVPGLFRYNSLLFRLLMEDRLEDAFELLMEMKESQISPDEVTMNAALCLFCKAGMVDAALRLYTARSEFMLTLNSLAYNFLINTLCGDGSIDKAFSVLQDAVDEGYFPGKKAFVILADAFCREGKLDKMKELLLFALDQNIIPSVSTYDKFISALCKAGRVEDGYLIYKELNKINEISARGTYFHLINGFNRLSRGDIAARLLIEMQEKGYKPSRTLFRAVIHCLSKMENPEKEFLKLLEVQLSLSHSSCQVYDFFIDGAGYAKKPELARGVYEVMLKSGIELTLSSDILMLQSYLKSERISDAVNFFNSLRSRRKFGRKIYCCMISGLCKANKTDIALEFLKEMKENKVNPSIECYELIIKLLCSEGRYHTAVTLINEFVKAGRSVTSFIGNTLLLHSLQSQELYVAWTHLNEDQEENSQSSMLGLLIGAFCGRVRVSEHIDHLEEEIGKCFTPDVFTYNILLRRLSLVSMDRACELFSRMRQKGYDPNQWTYDILVSSFFRHGMTKEGNQWLEEMLRRGFRPSESTTMLI
ncbi:Tetratricopeptide-like helical domain containing protein [Parasponia andersonii]|uniref:Tetratricopeptide-like helical domain containing protein n=1 Tax=Parasponia andersonii TaxID=3476 RepID=A0A2P5C397_PARAD|nr:Tetratricopeptide-like helical domain containing protein [Parasponia andersonii]